MRENERIKSVARASVLDEDSRVEIDLLTEAGERRVLNFPIADFEWFLARAGQLLMDVRIRKLSKGDHLAIQTVRAAEAVARAPAGGGRVILSIRGDNDLVANYALSPELAERLRLELFRAARDAVKDAKKSRH